MNLKSIALNKITQTQKTKYTCSFSYADYMLAFYDGLPWVMKLEEGQGSL